MARRSNNYHRIGNVTYIARAEQKAAQNKKGRRKQDLFLNIFFLVFVSFACFLFSLQYFQRQEAKGELNRLKEQLAKLEEETSQLERESELLHDAQYQEMQARKHLGMVRPGEIIFFVGE